MGRLRDYPKKLRIFQRTLEPKLLEVVKENEATAIDLNTSQLGEFGIDSTGKTLPGKYAPFTVDFKNTFGRGYGSIIDHITLFNTGDFHGSFFLDTSKFPVLFDASDIKRDMLVSEWGKDIFGLTPQNKDEFKEHTKPDIINLMKNGFLNV